MKIISVIGARPQFIKLAPIYKEIKKYDKIEHKVLHTGQHYDFNMSDIFFFELDLKADYNLGIGSGTHSEQTGRMLIEIEKVLMEEKPDLVMVYGDTNSTLAGALAAAKLHIPVAHVEAGVRSFNMKMPEEINRLLTDRISKILFCPTKTAVKNLKKEGHKRGIHFVGDVMLDILLNSKNKIEEKYKEVLQKFKLEEKNFCVATIHRQENTDDKNRLKEIFSALSEIGKKIKVLIPLHPRTKKRLKEFNLNPQNIEIIEPVSYFEMLCLQKGAKIVLTDSGGMQKESAFLKTPCLTLREETEWIETITSGWNILAGKIKKEVILEKFEKILISKSKKEIYKQFGAGKATKNIVKILNSFA